MAGRYAGAGDDPGFCCINPVLFGEQADFSRDLRAVAAGKIVFDPGSKIDGVDGASPKVKARSQLRVAKRDMHALCETFEVTNLGA
jgi:hypothetical protein